MTSKPVDERIGQFKDAEDQARMRWRVIAPVLDERQRRLWAAAEAQSLPKSGAAVVARATGLGHRTIRTGMRELGELDAAPQPHRPQHARIRRPGAGRKPIEEQDPSLLDDLDALVEPTRRGDPESPLRWTTKSTRNLAAALRATGHKVSPSKVGQLLREQGYSLQANKKTKEGVQHPDRDAQFHHINNSVAAFVNEGAPVVSVDTKKKELVGDYKNGGREWRSAGSPREVDAHDFPGGSLGKAIPYGVYDVVRGEAHVNVGMDHDTPTFAAESLFAWWRTMGKRAYPNATKLLVAADAGGSNAYKSRVWKRELQDFADVTGLAVHVCHFPPGTSKWNRIEHSLFSAISINWRGRPLRTFETVVSLIAATTNASGLRVRARLDKGKYPIGRRVSAAEFKLIEISRSEFHGEWNYVISPRALSK
jgi:transposase